MSALQNLIARALVRVAIAVAPAPVADELRKALGGGGPRPVKPS